MNRNEIMGAKQPTPTNQGVFAKLDEISKLMDILQGQQNQIENYLSAIAGPPVPEDPEMNKATQKLYDSALILDRLDVLIMALNRVGSRYDKIHQYLVRTISH
jgi:hypothetical protein